MLYLTGHYSSSKKIEDITAKLLDGKNLERALRKGGSRRSAQGKKMWQMPRAAARVQQHDRAKARKINRRPQKKKKRRERRGIHDV